MVISLALRESTVGERHERSYYDCRAYKEFRADFHFPSPGPHHPDKREQQRDSSTIVGQARYVLKSSKMPFQGCVARAKASASLRIASQARSMCSSWVFVWATQNRIVYFPFKRVCDK